MHWWPISSPESSDWQCAFTVHWFAELARYYMRRGLQRADAEDLAQETLIKILLAIREGRFRHFTSVSEFRGWIWTIARNSFFSEGRRLKRQPELVPLPQSDEEEQAGNLRDFKSRDPAPPELVNQFEAEVLCTKGRQQAFRLCLEQFKKDILTYVDKLDEYNRRFIRTLLCEVCAGTNQAFDELGEELDVCLASGRPVDMGAFLELIRDPASAANSHQADLCRDYLRIITDIESFPSDQDGSPSSAFIRCQSFLNLIRDQERSNSTDVTMEFREIVALTGDPNTFRNASLAERCGEFLRLLRGADGPTNDGELVLDLILGSEGTRAGDSPTQYSSDVEALGILVSQRLGLMTRTVKKCKDAIHEFVEWAKDRFQTLLRENIHGDV